MADHAHSVTVELVLDRVTRGAALYSEVDSNGEPYAHNGLGKLNTQYVRKHTFGEKVPERIWTTVAWD